VVVTRATWDKLAPKIRTNDDVKPEAVYEDLNLLEIDPTCDFEVNCETQLISVKDGVSLPAITAFRLLAAEIETPRPEQSDPPQDCLSFESAPPEPKFALLRAAVGHRLAVGRRDRRCNFDPRRTRRRPKPAAGLQHPPSRRLPARSRPIYVACPSCGRTLFDLQSVTARVKARTEHLKGVKSPSWVAS